MRHNASITVRYTERDEHREFHIFLDSYGTPDELKRFLREALRGRRREITRDSENFIVHLILAAGKRTEVNIITPRAAFYLWHYALHLKQLPPRINIRNNSTETSDAHELYAFLGPERRALSEVTTHDNVQHYGKRRRGRPSGLESLKAQGYLVNPPDYVKDGEPVFSHNKQKHKLKINLRDAEKYAPKK